MCAAITRILSSALSFNSWLRLGKNCVCLLMAWVVFAFMWQDNGAFTPNIMG